MLKKYSIRVSSGSTSGRGDGAYRTILATGGGVCVGVESVDWYPKHVRRALIHLWHLGFCSEEKSAFNTLGNVWLAAPTRFGSGAPLYSSYNAELQSTRRIRTYYDSKHLPSHFTCRFLQLISIKHLPVGIQPLTCKLYSRSGLVFHKHGISSSYSSLVCPCFTPRGRPNRCPSAREDRFQPAFDNILGY